MRTAVNLHLISCTVTGGNEEIWFPQYREELVSLYNTISKTHSGSVFQLLPNSVGLLTSSPEGVRKSSL